MTGNLCTKGVYDWYNLNYAFRLVVSWAAEGREGWKPFNKRTNSLWQ